MDHCRPLCSVRACPPSLETFRPERKNWTSKQRYFALLLRSLSTAPFLFLFLPLSPALIFFSFLFDKTKASKSRLMYRTYPTTYGTGTATGTRPPRVHLSSLLFSSLLAGPCTEGMFTQAIFNKGGGSDVVLTKYSALYSVQLL